MVTRARPSEIDWSTFPESDGEPMAETTAHAIQMVDLQWTLQTLFAMQRRDTRTAVGGNQLMYYNERDGREHVSPDVYVIFDRKPPPPPSWKTWVEGKFPDIVFEITSPNTHAQDLSVAPKGKRRLYAELEVGEYYIYDPLQETAPWFMGFELRDGRMEPLLARPDGGIYSPLLRAELRPVAMMETTRRPAGTWLRVIDPRTGEPIPIAEEEHDDLHVVRGRLTATQGRLTETREEVTALRGEVTTTREELTETREDVAALREQLAALERRQDPGTPPP